MFLDHIKAHLNPECAVMYREISELCGTNIQAAAMLSKFVYWADVKIRTEPASQGWFYKTAADLQAELGLTRRGYEKARKFLINKGIIQYRRGGVHGKMHWFVNAMELLRKIYSEVKGETVPKNLLNSQVDIDNFMMPSWMPRDEWNAYVQMRKTQGKPLSRKEKRKIINEKLKVWLKQGWDLAQIIERSLKNGWHDLYAPNNAPAPQITKRDPEADRVMAQINAQREREAQETANKPPPQQSKPREAKSIVSDLLNKIKQNQAKLSSEHPETRF